MYISNKARWQRRVAAEIAEKNAVVKGPASVRVGLLDQLYVLQEDAITSGVRITCS